MSTDPREQLRRDVDTLAYSWGVAAYQWDEFYADLLALPEIARALATQARVDAEREAILTEHPRYTEVWDITAEAWAQGFNEALRRFRAVKAETAAPPTRDLAAELIASLEAARSRRAAPPPALVREPSCVEQWPGCWSGEYDPRCCRFPKSCSVRMVPSESAAPPALVTGIWPSRAGEGTVALDGTAAPETTP